MTSGKFVFTIWFKTMPGTGSTQPSTITQPTTPTTTIVTQPTKTNTTVANNSTSSSTTSGSSSTTVNSTKTGSNTNPDSSSASNPYNLTVVLPTTNVDPIISPIINSTSTTVIKTNKTVTGTGDFFDAKNDTAL